MAPNKSAIDSIQLKSIKIVKIQHLRCCDIIGDRHSPIERLNTKERVNKIDPSVRSVPQFNFKSTRRASLLHIQILKNSEENQTKTDLDILNVLEKETAE